VPKARKSNSRRRSLLFSKKYSHKTVPLRVKLQQAQMSSLLEKQLTYYEELEKQVYADLEDKTVD